MWCCTPLCVSLQVKQARNMMTSPTVQNCSRKYKLLFMLSVARSRVTSTKSSVFPRFLLYFCANTFFHYSNLWRLPYAHYLRAFCVCNAFIHSNSCLQYNIPLILNRHNRIPLRLIPDGYHSCQLAYCTQFGKLLMIRILIALHELCWYL